ncbi:hypothetical protein [Kitasatospora paranensis]|uniref:Secreted protein n=1 Tax=Kitasatospora paranensis TaxID=258053 RepID=A0ABW2FRY0_9ACTN
MSTFKRIAVTAAAAAALTLGIANPASALEINDFVGSADTCGYVGFTTNGDTFRFLDACSDGRGVRLQYTAPTKGLASTSDAKTTKDYTGGYTGIDWGNAYVYDKDFAEGACFYFRVGLEKGGSYISGSYGSWRLACA